MTIRRNSGKNPLLYILKTIPKESEESVRARREWIERLVTLEVKRIMESKDMREKLKRLSK